MRATKPVGITVMYVRERDVHCGGRSGMMAVLDDPMAPLNEIKLSGGKSEMKVTGRYPEIP